MSDSSRPRGHEIAVAFIGLAGIVVTGVLSNLDRILHRPIVQAPYVGYMPTEDFEKELAYYFEVSGVNATMDQMVESLFDQYEKVLIEKFPDNGRAVVTAINAARKEMLRVDEIVRALLPVYRKHFTLNEVQELNKFYSTEAMRNMTRKMPLLVHDAAKIQVQLMETFGARLERKIEAAFQEPGLSDTNPFSTSTLE